MHVIRLQCLTYCCVLLIVGSLTLPATAGAPNVLFISVDDLNDWISPLGGHPQAKTPNLERFAKHGSVVFKNAFCAGPVCGPSRSALLSGFMPHRTGVYGNRNNMMASPLIQQHATLPEYFAKHGYRTISRGKIFHSHSTQLGQDRGQWAFQDWTSADRGVGVDRSRLTSRNKNLINGKPAPRISAKRLNQNGTEFSWGPTRGGVEETSDRKVARWAADQLGARHEQPFFLAVGLFRPHLPFYAPQEFFDLYDRDDVQVPPILEDDLDDILNADGTPKFKPSDDYIWLKHHGLQKDVVRAYLAMVSYADSNLGVIFDALENSAHADNTIVVVWGDHGWHLGEKLRYRKATGWGESTRVPLIVRTPKMTSQSNSNALVNLVDLYPTLVDYCDLPAKTELDGKSFVPLLTQPTLPWRDTSTTIFGRGNASVVSDHHRYIQYQDVTTEFYDLRMDPQEWNNLATSGDPAIVQARDVLAAKVPATFADAVQTIDSDSLSEGGYGGRTIRQQRDLTQLK